MLTQVRGGGKLMLLPSSTQDSAFLPHRRENNQPLINAINQLKPADVFVDIGSNVGFYSLRASQKLGPDGMVISFEPSLREFTRLTAAKQHNAHCCQWQLLNVAVGPKGRRQLNIHAGHTGMNHLQPRHSNGPSAHGESISVVALEDIMGLLGVGPIQLLKIDIEGFELQALRSFQPLLISGTIKTVVVEVTDRFLRRFGDSSDQLYEMMEECQFAPQIGPIERWQYDEVFHYQG